MRSLYYFIKNLFKLGKLLSVDDSGDFTFCDVTAMGKTQKALLFTPYGIMSNPTKPAMAVLISQQGQESNQVAMVDDPNNRPLKNLKDGEIAVGNYATGDYLLFNEAGECVFKVTADIIATAANFKLTASANIIASALAFELNGNGDNLVMWSTLNTQLQDFVSAFNSHTHAGGAAPDSSTSVDLTGAKANTLKTDG